jgi:hypothetical protein
MHSDISNPPDTFAVAEHAHMEADQRFVLFSLHLVNGKAPAIYLGRRFS